MKPAAIGLSALLAVTLAPQSPDFAAEGKAWWAHVRVLADDTLEGRNAGTPGYDKAVAYVEGQFKAIGLKPLEAAATFNRVILTLLQRVATDDARPTWNAESFFKRFSTR